MPHASTKDVDPADQEHREIGEGLFEEEMGPSSAMAHLYRGEIHRMKYWRERLDRTTNWAVLVMATIITWAFAGLSSGGAPPHYVLLIGAVFLSVFLLIEARRYRGYEIWRTRVRIFQENVIAYGLDPSVGLTDPDWRKKLSEDYRSPTIKISAEEAIAHRLRRVYLPLFGILLGAWLVRITSFSTLPWTESAAVGTFSGEAVAAAVACFFIAALAVALRPRTWRARGELRNEDLRS